MDITYLGHASFKLRGKEISLVCDPFDLTVGFSYPRVSADIVTVSHDHKDHNNISGVSGTSRREESFVIKYPGEFEVSGVSIVGVSTFHDSSKGEERGDNIVFVIGIDGITLVHLGDLGHILTERQLDEIGEVDVVFVPVGGVYTIGPKQAVEVLSQLQPSLAIPMHCRTSNHDEKTFGKLATVQDFLSDGGFSEVESRGKVSLTRSDLPEEMEVVVLKREK